MSGDAQARKRKNKGKKKEDGGEEEIFTPLKNPSDEVIHVHKDIGCGGNLITKLIFFGILATIGVMVGVILLEYRGSSDEETFSAADSPWSLTLEKWVDNEASDVHHHAEDNEPLEDDGTSGHDDDHHHELDQDHKHEEEAGVPDEVNSILSWFSFSGEGKSNDDHESSDDGGWFPYDSLLTLFPFGGNRDDGSEGKDEDGDSGWFGLGGSSSQVEESSGVGIAGWFGFGGEDKDVDQEGGEEGSQEETDEQEDDEEEELEDEEFDERDNDEDEEIENEDDEEGLEESQEELEDSREELEDSREELEDSHEELDESKEELEDSKEELEESAEEENEEEEEDNYDIENKSEEEPDSAEDLKYSAAFNDLSEEEDERDDLSEREENEEDENVSEEIVQGKIDKDDESEDEGYDENLSNEDEEDERDSQEKENDDKKENDLDSEEAAQLSKEHTSEEELFPEALEALRREREELAKQAEVEKEVIEKEEVKDEGYVESDNESLPEGQEEETEGMALKFGVGVALVVVAHVVLVKKWNSWAGEDAGDLMSETPATPDEWKEEVRVEPVAAVPVSNVESPAPKPAYEPSPPIVPTPSQEPAEESPIEDEEEEETGDEDIEAEGEEEESEGEEIDKDKFKELIAKYGQDTPESSDIEQSDDDIQKVEYSEGEESAGDETEDSPAEVVSEDDLGEWTGIKKSDIDKIVKLDSGSEGEEEEEESEDEEPPTLQPARQQGGPKAFEDIYPNDLITNEEDWAIKEELDRADEEFNYEKAHFLFTALLEKHPNSPRARYGIALSLDGLAEQTKSNKLLETAINSYYHALAAPGIPDNLYIKVCTRLVNRLRFRGRYLKAAEVQKQLVQRFNSTPEYRTDMAITYMMINDLENARIILKDTLKVWPEDPFALSHYGLVLKLQGNIYGCIKYLEKGLSSDFPNTRDARLFFHLGDALARVGRETDALQVYDKAVAYGLFRSRYQRSLYNVDHLTGRPWWTHEQTTYQSFFKMLEDNWLQIRDEGEKALRLNGMYRDEAENLRDKGDWKQFELFARGSEIKKNCQVTPFTCSVIRSFEPAATCKRGQSKFSVMEGGTHVWSHCGPTNCRLRAHLGLIVPNGPLIRVANISKTWEEGKVMVFDDSFEHEVWHKGSSLRLVLIVDVWHPELTKEEKKSLSPI